MTILRTLHTTSFRPALLSALSCYQHISSVHHQHLLPSHLPHKHSRLTLLPLHCCPSFLLTHTAPSRHTLSSRLTPICPAPLTPAPPTITLPCPSSPHPTTHCVGKTPSVSVRTERRRQQRKKSVVKVERERERETLD